MTAIDISYWNGHPNFAQVAASGVTLVIMKCADGEGSRIVDDSVYLSNRAAARAQGLATGSYFFNGNATSPTAAADHQFAICDYRAGDKVAIDVEGGAGIVWSPGQVLEWVNRMLTHGVSANDLLVYMSASLTRLNWGSVISTGARLWVASYGANNPADIGPHGSPTVGQWGSYALWQHTSVAHCPGIVGYVDTNVFGTMTAGNTYTPIGENMPLDANDQLFLNTLGASIVDQVNRATIASLNPVETQLRADLDTLHTAILAVPAGTSSAPATVDTASLVAQLKPLFDALPAAVRAKIIAP